MSHSGCLFHELHNYRGLCESYPFLNGRCTPLQGKLSCGLFSEPQTDQPIMLPLGGPQTRHPYESYHPAASPPSTVIQSSEALSGTNLNHATLPPLVQSEEADLADPPSRRHRSRNPLKRLFSKSMSKLKHRSASQPPSPERMLSSSEAGGSHKLFQRSRSASQPPSPERGAFPPPHRGWFSKSSKKGKSLPTTPTGKGPGELGAHVRRPSGYYYQVDVAPSLSPVPSWLPPQDSQSRSSAPSAGPVEDLPTTPRGADYGARGPPWSAPTTPQSHEVIQWSGPSTPTVTETPPSSGPSSPLPTMASQWYSPGKSAGAVTLNQSAESLTPNQSAESLTQSYENLPRSGPESPTRESAQTIPPVPHNSPSQQSSWQTYGDRTVVTSSPMSGVSVQGGTSPSLEDPLVFEVPVLGLPQEKRAELGMKPPHFSEVQEFGKDEAPSPISVMDRSGYESPGVQDGVAVSHPLAEISEEPGSDTPSEYEDASDGLRTAGSGFADETAGEAGVKDSPVESGEEGVDTGSCAGVPPGAEQSVNTALGAEHEAGAALEQKEPEESGAREVEFVEVSETQNVSGFEPSEMEERDGSEAWKEEPIAVSQPQSEKGLTPSEVEERGGSGVRKEGSAASSELQTETGKSEFEERSEGGIRKEGAAEVVEPHDETGPEAQTFEERPESGLGKAAVAESPEPRHEMGSRPLDFEELGRQAVRKGGVVASLEPLVEKETRASDLEEHPESRLSKEETVESSLPQSGTVFSALAKRNGSAGEKASSGAVSELLNKIVRSGHEEVGSAGFGSVARVPVPANGEELGAEESGTGGAGVPVAGETESVPEKTILPEQGLAEEPSEGKVVL